MRNKRLQSQITAGRWTLPAVILICTLFWVLTSLLLPDLTSSLGKEGGSTIWQSTRSLLLPSWADRIVSYLVYAFLSGRTGFVNGLLTSLGKENISFYTESKYWPFILIFVNCWKGAGYSSIIYLAAILGIDQEMYEAAEIDGATRWHKIKCITLPLLKSTVVTMTLLSIGRIFYSDFGLFYQVPMNSGALINATNTIDTYVYRGLIELGDISMSSAACVYQSLMGFALVMIANWLTKRYSSENALF